MLELQGDLETREKNAPLTDKIVGNLHYTKEVRGEPSWLFHSLKDWWTSSKPFRQDILVIETFAS